MAGSKDQSRKVFLRFGTVTISFSIPSLPVLICAFKLLFFLIIWWMESFSELGGKIQVYFKSHFRSQLSTDALPFFLKRAIPPHCKPSRRAWQRKRKT